VGWGSTPMSDLRWVDASQFLYLVPEAPDWDLCLGKRGDEAGRLLADRIDFPMYDFTVH
jgi:hypothetical protein